MGACIFFNDPNFENHNHPLTAWPHALIYGKYKNGHVAPCNWRKRYIIIFSDFVINLIIIIWFWLDDEHG